MEGRKRMVDRGGPTLFEVGDERIDFRDCHTFAELGNLPANVLDYVYKLADGRFLRVTIGTDSDSPGDVFTAADRWYSARLIDEAEAVRWRQSWAMHREQPEPITQGPWR